MSVWSVMIVVHAASAIVALAASTALLSLRRARSQAWLVPILLVALAVMTIGNTAATISHWNTIFAGERITFIALAILALYTLYQGWRVKQLLNQPKAYTNRIGFVWIVLVEGLIVLAPLGLHAPAWITAVVTIITLALSLWVVSVAKRHNLKYGIEKA